MSTQYDIRPTTTPGHHTPRHERRSGYRVAAITIGSVIAAALVALAALGLTHSHTTSNAPAAPSSTSAPASANPAQPTTPAAVPSASVKKLQQELGQLNYYEGPVDGFMGPQTTAAIKDLQRQANLPQTGTMNAATQAALDNYLVHGNNQMAG
jgi:peptidoglycan hydrolase-like protein with peptidoglycan-binding domain